MTESAPAGPPGASVLHPVLLAAARGHLPPWARATAERRAHMRRVADLLEEWALERGEPAQEVIRWRAAGHLHDALRDQEPEALRGIVEEGLKDLPPKVLHGPAVAARLRSEGVTDEELLTALRFHTLGSPDLGTLGIALYAADFLEPGRGFRADWTAALRKRAPLELEAVAREILSARIRYLVERGRPLHPQTVGFWNRWSEGEEWASASEF